MLERLYVDNYRCFVDFECHFGPKQLILGSNGSGKTTLFNVLATLRNFCIAGLPTENLFSGVTKTGWLTKQLQVFTLDVSGNAGLYTFKLVIDCGESQTDRPRVVLEEVNFSGKPLFRFEKGTVYLFGDDHKENYKYPFDASRSSLATIGEHPLNGKLMWFKRWLGSILIISPDPHQMSPVAEAKVYIPTTNLSNFASWYKHCTHAMGSQKVHELTKDIQEVIPGFNDLRLEAISPEKEMLLLDFVSPLEKSQPTKKYSQLFSELSDGQRVLVCLYAVLHFALKSGAIIGFDEPDNFIALREIHPWLEKVLEFVDNEETNAQVLIISHHPELLNRMAFESGLRLDRSDGRGTLAEKFKDSAETGLSPAELITRGWENE